jgi:hypothetical protein
MFVSLSFDARAVWDMVEDAACRIAKHQGTVCAPVHGEAELVD